MMMGHGNLKNALEYGPEPPLGFMPKGLESVVTFVPLAAIKGSQSRLKATILLDQRFL